MTELLRRMQEDRALRGSARRLLEDDLRWVRADIQQRSLGGRVMDRLVESTVDIADDATDFVLEHKRPVVAAAGAALVAGVLWLLRDRVLDMVAPLFGINADEAEQADIADRCEDD
ncbi:MAG: hypothetical protein RLZZ08_1927 [Pseudomonadota bacterium]|jgi:hypothetical protein